MPIFLDRHDMVEQSAEETALLHLEDLKIQKKYGVRFLTYWYDADRKTTFCLVDAPDKETADRVHAEAHGHVANQMIEVNLSAVEAFLGRVQDPASAPAAPINDTAFRAIMFTDIVGSTALTSEVGDMMSLELVRAHDAIIRRHLESHAGKEVKHLGDGIMASFDDVAASVSSALEMQAAFDLFRSHNSVPIHIRIGIHAGEPVEDSNDLFGQSVQKASRICAAAPADGIRVSSEVMRVCGDEAFEFERKGSELLKGFTDPVDLFSPISRIQ